jgi:hypothetical protein
VNVELLELAAAALSDLLADVVFLGGATIELSTAAPSSRPRWPQPDDVRRYLGEEARRLFDTRRLLDGLAGAMRPDAASQQRVDNVILPALHNIADQPQRR